MERKQFDENGTTAEFMVRMSKPLWVSGKLVVIYRSFCVVEGIILMVGKCVFGSAFINKQRYWQNGVPVENNIRHIQKKEVGDLDAVSNIICGKIYHIMALKKPEYVMRMMTKYGMLDNLEGSYTQKRNKVSGREVVTKRFNFSEVFCNHFRYRHQFDKTTIIFILIFLWKVIGQQIMGLTISMLTS